MTQSEKRLFLIQSLLKERPEYRQVETPRTRRASGSCCGA